MWNIKQMIKQNLGFDPRIYFMITFLRNLPFRIIIITRILTMLNANNNQHIGTTPNNSEDCIRLKRTDMTKIIFVEFIHFDRAIMIFV